jgi:putative transposase
VIYNKGMTNYRRSNFPGGYYFFTVVTHKRAKFLTSELALQCLRTSFLEIKEKRPFEIIASCLLPDHIHCIWKLPDGDNDFSYRWSAIKAGFTRKFLSRGGLEGYQAISRQRKRERGLWQRRFWEHQIKDEADLQKHVDYIHYNPIKHGLAKQVEQWPWSTFHKYYQAGIYSKKDLVKDGAQIDDVLAGE